MDGENYFVIEDKSEVNTGSDSRFSSPRRRIFGAVFKIDSIGNGIWSRGMYFRNAYLNWRRSGAGNAGIYGGENGRKRDGEIKEKMVGYNILWGFEKLHHSWMTFGNSQKILALVTGKKNITFV